MQSFVPRFNRSIRAAHFRISVVLFVAGAGACAKNPNQPEREQKQMGQRIKTLLMFDGQAEEAMNFYVSLFDNAEIVSIQRYGPGESGTEGSVMQAVFSIDGQEFMCIDSSVKHEFTFTPAISLFVTCDSEAEIDELFAKLSEGGQVLMPLDKYPFSRRFGWVADRFGVSWQLNLPNG